MGLIHRSDIVAWRRWQQSRHRLRQLRHRLAPDTGSPHDRLVLTTYGSEPRLLVALDSKSPTSRAALIEPVARLGLPVAVLSAGPPPDLGGSAAPSRQPVGIDVPDALRGVAAVVSLGHHLPCGELSHQWATMLDARSIVVQHGALTPQAPPLPAQAHLLAWTAGDADFWTSGRTDVDHQVVGSQLLWEAGERPAALGLDDRTTYLGQLHAAELSRSRLVHAALTHCRAHAAVYRPHPAERDRLSRLAHDAFRRVGVAVDGSAPLSDLGGPVTSVFSTGVLEAAAQGRDAWVDFPRPPAWLEEFWERYGMHRLGSSPTPGPERPRVEPAHRIAEILTEVAS